MGNVLSPKPGFAFQLRPACICGARLDGAVAPRVIRHCWGDIQFQCCPQCGSWCQSPQVTPVSLADWYDSDFYQGSGGHSGDAYDNYEADEPQRHAESRQRFARDISPWLNHRPANILEIGCASGSLLAVAREAGHQVTGVDLSARFAEQARRLNRLEIVVGDFLHIPLPEYTYDAVLLFGTASNLVDFPQSLRRIRQLMRPNGRMFLNFPHSDSWLARLYGRQFWMFAPSVATFASTAGMARCATHNGWTVEALSLDHQRPSFRKLIKHTKLAHVLPEALTKLVSSRLLPVSLPIPAVKLARLRPVGDM